MGRIGFKTSVISRGSGPVLSVLRFSIADMWCDQVMASLLSIGVRHVVIAPGSRSTPLVMAAHRCDGLTLLSHYDERGLGFYALGIAKASRRPVAIVVTSGTAVANLLPAVIEAFQMGIPLALLTADRPPELWDTGANQCIRQVGIFSHYVVAEWCMPVPTVDISLGQLMHQLRAIWTHFLGNRPGPIHLNCPFREPLYGDTLTEFVGVDCPVDYLPSTPSYGGEFLMRVCDDFFAGVGDASGVIIVGQAHDIDEVELIVALAEKLGWMILADVTSSLKSLRHPLIFTHYDLAFSLHGQSMMAGVTRVLLFGGFCVSKRLISWLGTSGVGITQVMNGDFVWQPGVSISTKVTSGWRQFCEAMLTVPALSSAHGMSHIVTSRLQDINRQIASSIAESVVGDPLTEPCIGAWLFQWLPSQWSVMIGNSLPVRLLDQWGLACDRAVTVYSNRGASGIDGLIASSAGIALGCQLPVVLWLGDMSFAYDVSSLSLISRSPVPIIILVTNNNGGRIFEQLSVAKSDIFEPYFVLPDLPSIKYASQMVNLPYYDIQMMSQLSDLFITLGQAPFSCIIEVKCDSSHISRCLSHLKKS